MKKALLPLLLSAVTLSAQAQVYKCEVDGRIVFTDLPCSLADKDVSAAPAPAGQAAAQEDSSALFPPRLATDATPVAFPATVATDLFNYTLWACSLQDTDQILTNFSSNTRNLIAQSFAAQLESPKFYADRLCRQITKLVNEDLQGKPAEYVYATTNSGNGVRLCILAPGATNLSACVDGLAVTLEDGGLKFDESR